MIAKISLSFEIFAWKTAKKCQITIQPVSLDPKLFHCIVIWPKNSLFHALRNVGKTNLFPKVAYFSSRLYVFFTRTTKNKRKKLRITYPKRLVPHQKTFDLEIGRIDHGRRFRSSGNGAWLIRFKTTHADGLSGCWGTLNVKGLVEGGNFAAQ